MPSGDLPFSPNVSGYTRTDFDKTPTSPRSRVYGDPNSSTPTRPKGSTGDTGPAGLSKGVIHSKEQEDANVNKARTGGTFSNSDL